MLSWIVPRPSARTRPARPAILPRVTVRHGVALALALLAALALSTALPARMFSVGGDHIPTMLDPLPVRVRYIQTLVADADYQLALKPHVILVWRWQINVLPAPANPQRAWDDTQRIAAVADDQPDVLSLLWHIQLTYQRIAQDSGLAQQMHDAYTPDYAPVGTLLDVIGSDLAATLAVPTPVPDNERVCPVCAVE